MKTRSEIEAEARQLTVRARECEAEQARLGPLTSSVTRILTILPAPLKNFDVQSGQSSLREHAVMVFGEKGELFFRLAEREIDIGMGGQSLSEAPWSNVMESTSALDILYLGYERSEKERIGNALSAFAERMEERGVEMADSDVRAEVESIVESSTLPVSDRMRIRGDITEFIEGRLPQNEMISRTLRRHFRRAEVPERLAMRHEFKLTIGEP